jgi:release factor glutamine methyltransferase
MNVQHALAQGAAMLAEAAIPAPRLTAEVLLAHAIGCDRVWLMSHGSDPMQELWWIHYGRYLHERLQGKPTQYITRKQEFYGREFIVSPAVLIPRPETEHVIEAALELAPHGVLADIGTGSGAIAITLALEGNYQTFAGEISRAALSVARENARKLGARIRLVEADLASAFAASRFDLVVSNPPYVPLIDKHTIQVEVRDHEPPVALYGGNDGFEIYRRLIPDAARILKPGGWLIMELGYSSATGVLEMLAGWHDVSLRPDLAGIPRVVQARRA